MIISFLTAPVILTWKGLTMPAMEMGSGAVEIKTNKRKVMDYFLESIVKKAWRWSEVKNDSRHLVCPYCSDRRLLL